jgi:hypothetical protein
MPCFPLPFPRTVSRPFLDWVNNNKAVTVSRDVAHFAVILCARHRPNLYVSAVRLKYCCTRNSPSTFSSSLFSLTLLALNLSGPPGAPGSLNGYGYQDIYVGHPVLMCIAFLLLFPIGMTSYALEAPALFPKLSERARHALHGGCNRGTAQVMGGQIGKIALESAHGRARGADDNNGVLVLGHIKVSLWCKSVPIHQTTYRG